MKRFEIGPGLSCELDTLVNTRLLIQANSGAGKSFLLRRLLEQSHGKIQHLVIDPEGEFASLREQFDYVLAARQGGDTLADARVAKLLAERLLELGVSAILDIYELAPRERVAFVRAFLESLVDAPKHLWHPVLVVLDEAHVYCPEQGEAESADAVKGLCTRGRKRGFCAVLATQRLSKLHKDAAAECNNKLIGRSSLDVDMKRAANELGFTAKDQMLSLRTLAPGEFYAYGPAFNAPGVTTVRVGSVTTHHPKAGSKLAGVAPPPTDKVKALLPKLSDLPQEAEQRERTVKDLQREIADLKKQVKILQAGPNDTGSYKSGPLILTDADRALLARIGTAIGDIGALLHERDTKADERLKEALRAVLFEHAEARTLVTERTVDAVERQLHSKGLQKILAKLEGVAVFAVPDTNVSRAISRAAPQRLIVPSPQPRNTVAPGTRNQESALPPGEHATLTAALQYEGLDRKRLGILTGYKRSSRDAYIVRLAQKGLVEVRGSQLFPTDEGRLAMNGSFEPLPTGEALVEYWRARLPEGERKTLDVLLAHPQTDVDRDIIDQVTGYKRSSRDAYLVRLKARGLVEFAGRGMVRASGELFD